MRRFKRGNFQLSGEDKTAMTIASKNIGWIGVGKMGLPMSVLVAKAGYAVTAFDQSQPQLASAREQGIAIASSL